MSDIIKKAYGILRDAFFFSLILSRELLLWARAHSRSFWNFTIQWTSHDDLTEKSADIFQFKHPPKKLVKWQKFKTALCNLTEILLPSNFVFVQKYARLKEEALGLTVQCTYSRWFHWRGECSRYILLLLLHTFDMHYHSADISPPSYQIAHPTRSTPFTHHWKKISPIG